ncbi:MAG TPA: aspartate-semialdehyde dehydrogenase [Clostridiales bacterium]|nr:aspartate-semialdehyde dehydrogenase [Clostridiales bacterium]
MNLAVIGATGLVGRKITEQIFKRGLKPDKLYLYASERSDGKILRYNGNEYVVKKLAEGNIPHDIDFAFFSAGSEISKIFAPIFRSRGALVIDNSSAFRLFCNVPLVVPEVNGETAFFHNGIIANPNCSTIQACVALSPLDKAFGLKRVIVSTYQAVSGAGQRGTNDFYRGKNGLPPEKFPKNIYLDCVPQIDCFAENGYTKEELKIINETRKILSLKKLKITATAVRVPVLNCHAESVNAEFFKPCDEQKAKKILSAARGVVLLDDPEKGVYPTASDADGKEQVFIGRVRQDFSVESAINMWVVADNLLKGAAANAVSIAELLIKGR